MKLLDKYLIYSSIFALFTEDFNFHYLIDWKLFYLIMVINFVILLSKKQLFINKNLVVIILVLLAHGLLFFIIFKNPIGSLLAQILGISLSSIFYYSFIRSYGANLVFHFYLKVAFWLAVLAIPMFILNINTFDDYRLNGVLSEPAHYAAIMLPAVYVLLRDKQYFKFTVVFLTIILSKSTVGYFGLLLILILPLIKVKYFLKYAIITLVILFISGLYISSNWNNTLFKKGENDVMLRIKQTKMELFAIIDGKFKNNTNLSSYAFLSNSFITFQSFIPHPFGTGLGSYKHQYDRYYPLMSPPDYLITLKFSKINKQDANSLFLRMLVDLGIFTFIFIGYFIHITIKIFKHDKSIIQQGIFFYLIIKLIREGHYFPPELYFFLIIFIKYSYEDTSHSRRLLAK